MLSPFFKTVHVLSSLVSKLCYEQNWAKDPRLSSYAVTDILFHPIATPHFLSASAQNVVPAQNAVPASRLIFFKKKKKKQPT